jgi:restriction endonuclease Mrr
MSELDERRAEYGDWRQHREEQNWRDIDGDIDGDIDVDTSDLETTDREATK